MTQEKNGSAASSRSEAQTAGRMFLYVLFLFIACYLGITYWNGRNRRNRLQHQKEIYREKLQKLRRANRVLAEKNRHLKRDPQAIERIFREEYHLLKENEYRIVDDR